MWDLGESKNVRFGGRTDDAQIETSLVTYLQETFTNEAFEKKFGSAKVTLFGEGYGGNIQEVGKKYSETNKFTLFDANIDGWWLEPDKIEKLAAEIGIGSVPELGLMDEEEIVSCCRGNTYSKISKEKLIAEGIVARAHPQVLFRDGTPVMFKLKTKDYKRIER